VRPRAAPYAAARLAVAAPACALGVLLAVAPATPACAQIAPPPPPPPPLAFRDATLVREHRAIEVAIIAVADVHVTVIVSRAGTRLGRGPAAVRQGRTVVPVRIGPRGIKPLRKGLHVDVRIFYGPPEPLLAHPALLLRRAPLGQLA
jgi:hypothetical protein